MVLEKQDVLVSVASIR